MPLGFHSLSHGVIAYGFFNIETDLLLMHQHVFWCRDFCELVTDLAKTAPDRLFQARLKTWFIANPADLGDLHGAIAGRAHYGLIGEIYRRWPFPENMADFHQKPSGIAPKKEVAEIAEQFGKAQELEVSADAEKALLSLGQYQFNPNGACALADYVWRGGMPGWLGGERPDYLWEAAEGWREAVSPFVTNMRLDPMDAGVPG